MIEIVPIAKDQNNQSPVPSVWRGTFVDIVQALSESDFRLERGVAGVCAVSAKDADVMARNVDAYGARLASLPEEAWNTSVCQWMVGYWDVLVDLFTIDEGLSDLVLAVRVYEDGVGYSFKIQSVYVP